MITDVLLFIGGLCLLLLVGAVDGRCEEQKLAIKRLSERLEKVEAPAAEQAAYQPAPGELSSDFAVTGKPIKPSWRVRKRELEAAARTKRKQFEEFRGDSR